MNTVQPPSPRGTSRILVVDDDVRVLKTTVKTLTDAGYDVVSTSKGTETLAMCHRDAPDLVLLDVVMPDANGYELCRAIKSEPSFADMFVILVSGLQTSSDNKVDGLEMRADDYVIRPIPAKELVARVRTALRLQSTQKALRASDERYRLLFESAEVLACVYDRDGVCRLMNRKAAELYGGAAEEFVGVSLSDLHPDDGAEQARRVREVIDSGTAQEHEEEIRFPGGPRWLLSRVHAVPDADGVRRIAQVIAHDITDRKRSEKERETLKDQLRRVQKLNALGQMAADVSHKFNNLLTAIRGNAELAGMYLEQHHRAHEPLGLVHQAIDQANEVVRSLVSFGRGMSSTRQVVALCDVTGDAGRLIRHALPANITLQINIDCEDPCHVSVDPGQLQQVLLMLSLNARDAMPKGGTLTIDVSPAGDEPPTETPGDSSQKSGDWHRLRVADTGTGMSSEVRERVFEPFFTTKANHEATGLGLAIVRGIIEDHGGRITVESEIGAGTSVTITLPRAPAPEAGAGGERSVAEPRGRGRRILLCGVGAYLSSTIAAVLHARHYDVLQAEDEDGLLTLFEEHGGAIRLVVADMHRGGLGYLRTIRSRGDLPVILLTGSGGNDKSRPDERTVVVREPFQVGELADVIGDLLDTDIQ